MFSPTSLPSTAEPSVRCICGRRARRKHSGYYCSTKCAQRDAANKLEYGTSHYRTAVGREYSAETAIDTSRTGRKLPAIPPPELQDAENDTDEAVTDESMDLDVPTIVVVPPVDDSDAGTSFSVNFIPTVSANALGYKTTLPDLPAEAVAVHFDSDITATHADSLRPPTPEGEAYYLAARLRSMALADDYDPRDLRWSMSTVASGFSTAASSAPPPAHWGPVEAAKVQNLGLDKIPSRREKGKAKERTATMTYSTILNTADQMMENIDVPPVPALPSSSISTAGESPAGSSRHQTVRPLNFAKARFNLHSRSTSASTVPVPVRHQAPPSQDARTSSHYPVRRSTTPTPSSPAQSAFSRGDSIYSSIYGAYAPDTTGARNAIYVEPPSAFLSSSAPRSPPGRDLGHGRSVSLDDFAFAHSIKSVYATHETAHVSGPTHPGIEDSSMFYAKELPSLVHKSVYVEGVNDYEDEDEDEVGPFEYDALLSPPNPLSGDVRSTKWGGFF